VDRNGRRLSGFDTSAFARLAGGRFVSLPRGELAASVFAKIRDATDTIFGDEISAIDQSPDGVEVRFARAPSRRFDLVIGADGLHSRVRALAFGPESGYEKFLGYRVAAFEAEGYRPRDDLVYVMYTEVGQQVARFTMRGNRTLFLFIWSGAGEEPAGTLEEQKASLRRRFGSSGWECRQILDRLDGSADLYFDRVSGAPLRRILRAGIEDVLVLAQSGDESPVYPVGRRRRGRPGFPRPHHTAAVRLTAP
jgi:2-polyprenyl-6-methoxyphenol hydroxylase-like FAD-dependent oxidoreductase